MPKVKLKCQSKEQELDRFYEKHTGRQVYSKRKLQKNFLKQNCLNTQG